MLLLIAVPEDVSFRNKDSPTASSTGESDDDSGVSDTQDGEDVDESDDEFGDQAYDSSDSSGKEGVGKTIGEASSSDDDDDGGGDARHMADKSQKGFLEGGKDDTFSRAVSRILGSSGSLDVQGPHKAPILAGSKSLARRKEEEEERLRAERAARKLRREMRQRGHIIPAKRGLDPGSDVREKALQRTATKGVVRLFNAVAKAQRQLKEAEEISGNRYKAAKLGKASFLAELRKNRSSVISYKNNTLDSEMTGNNATDEVNEGDKPGKGVEEREPGWDVLQDSFTGLHGGNKMKDWDRKRDEEADQGEISDHETSDSSEGW